MRKKVDFHIEIEHEKTGCIRGKCRVRGDLGCLACNAKESGYRVEELAGRLGVTSRVLRRVFKENCKIGIKNWMAQIRETEVQARLQGDESIQEIAISVGFAHSKDLAREFRKAYGMTPSAYRRKVKMKRRESSDSIS